MGLIDHTVSIGSSILPNPVGVASGTFGYGSEYETLIDCSKLGALFTKAVTLKPRSGNDIPRIVETPGGIINSIGLANVGIEHFLTEKLPQLSQYGCPVIPNVAGSTENEYFSVVERLESSAVPWGYEINVSCPNVKHGGLAFGTDPNQIERLTRTIRSLTSKPLIIKLTPNVTDITTIAHAAESGGADAVSCINTCIGMIIDIDNKRPALPMKTGGLSGPAIRPIGVAMVYKVSRAVSIPIFGIGGIMQPNDALEYLLAGASAVQIGTGTFIDPQLPLSVIQGIDDFCKKELINSVTTIKTLLKD